MPESIVEWKPRPRDRVLIKLSGGRFFTIPQDAAAPLQSASVISDEDIERLSRIDQYFRGKDKALRLLAIRPRTKREVTTALTALEITAPILGGIIEELEELGLVDDRRFALDYIRSKVENKGLGPHRLRVELRRLGVGSAIVDGALADEVSSGTQLDAARRLARRKLGARTPDEGDVRRIGALLRRKGIDYEIINSVMYELLEEARSNASFDEHNE